MRVMLLEHTGTVGWLVVQQHHSSIAVDGRRFDVRVDEVVDQAMSRRDARSIAVLREQFSG